MPYDVETSAVEQKLRVLQSIADGEGTFADPRMQAAAWACAEDRLIADRIAVYPDADNVTRADTAPVRGAWKWIGLTDKGKAYLANGGPPQLPTFTEEDSPERQEARVAAIERARKIASEA
jgi:hypothetical protein